MDGGKKALKENGELGMEGEEWSGGKAGGWSGCRGKGLELKAAGTGGRQGL